MVEVRTIADGFLNYTKATAISLNGIRLLCYLGILCRVALTDHSTRKIPGRYHIYILLMLFFLNYSYQNNILLLN